MKCKTCGHERVGHYEYMMDNTSCMECKCEKFIPSNQSQRKKIAEHILKESDKISDDIIFGTQSPPSEDVAPRQELEGDTQTLSSYIHKTQGSIPVNRVKTFIKQDSDLIEDLLNQLINDFRTPLSIISAKRFIRARIKKLKEDRFKLAGDKLT